jgi:ParB/RepB/Spo0J family partition protein
MSTTTETLSDYAKVRVKDVIVGDRIRKNTLEAIAAMAEDVKVQGLLEPLVLSPAEGKPGKYDLIDGECRLRAVEKLGWEDVPAHVVLMPLEADRVGAELKANLQRTDFNPIQRARGFRRYLDARRKLDPKLTQEAVAKALGISPGEFSNTLQLIEQEVHIQKLVEDGQLSESVIEKAVAPLGRRLAELGLPAKKVEEEVKRFAQEIAGDRHRGKQALDVKTAKAYVEDVVAKERGLVQKSRFGGVVKAAKVPECPVCGKAPRTHREIEGRVVLTCENSEVSLEGSPVDEEYVQDELEGWEGATASDRKMIELNARFGHNWYADDGTLYLTQKDRKEMEREKANAEREAREEAKEAAKERVKKKEKAPVVDREPTVWWSLATVKQWRDAGQRTLEEAGIGDICFRPNGVDVVAARPIAFPGLPQDRFGFDPESDEVYVTAVNLPEYPEFKTRVQMGITTSWRPGGVDHIAEGEDAKRIRKLRVELLAYQKSRMGVAQKDGGENISPEKVGGFRLGDIVRVKGKVARARILRFDLETEFDEVWERLQEGRAFRLGKEWVAFLDTHRPAKVFPVKDLLPEKVEGRWSGGGSSCVTCGGSYKTIERENPETGKTETIHLCEKCGRRTDSCTCKPREKKTAKKGRAKKAAKK